jgi:hypothetical protein
MITDSLPDNWGWGVESIADGDSGGSGGSSTDAEDSDDPNAGTEFGQEGDDYYGQSELEDLYTPDTGQDPAIDDSDDGFQGEDSWMDYQEDEDGAGSRYDRDTPWTTDAALQFDTDVVDRLTVPDLDFSAVQEAAFSERGQTLDDVGGDVDPEPTGASQPDGLPASWRDLPDGWQSSSSGGIDSTTLALGAAAIVAVGAIAYVGVRDD